jgi:hypothetical protein
MAGRWRELTVWEAVVIGLLLFGVILLLVNIHWSLSDVSAYEGAARRLVDGQSLYPPLSDERSADVFRYAPWFAVAWVPMLALPEVARDALWSGILIVSSVAAAWPLLSHRRLVVTVTGLFAAAWLLGGAKYGNVEPLMIALLVWGVPRRWGPVAVGIAASLKIAPILLVLVWVGRREWGKVALGLGVAALLLAPMLLYDLSSYPIEATALISVRRAFGDVAWIALVAVLGVAAILASRTRFAWAVADLAVLSAYPQLPLYRLGILLVGTQPHHGSAADPGPDAGADPAADAGADAAAAESTVAP